MDRRCKSDQVLCLSYHRVRIRLGSPNPDPLVRFQPVVLKPPALALALALSPTSFLYFPAHVLYWLRTRSFKPGKRVRFPPWVLTQKADLIAAINAAASSPRSLPARCIALYEQTAERAADTEPDQVPYGPPLSSCKIAMTSRLVVSTK